MPTGPMTAVEAVSPAFERAKRQLFQPFRFWRCSRLALISLLAGELGTGGNWGRLGDLPGRGRSGNGDEFFFLAPPPWGQWQDYLPVIAAAVISALLLAIVFIYIASIFRFLLLDAVLKERVRIREGRHRWQVEGGRYFLWQLGYSAVLITLLGIVVGLPLLYAWRHGMFSSGGQHVGTLVAGGLLMFFAAGLLVVAALLVTVFTKDFVVPLMALEGIGAVEAWRRLWPMLKTEKGSYAGYIGMKIVLAIASAIFFGIITVIALFVILIPLVVLGMIVGVLAAALHLTWNALTIVLVVLVGAAAIFGLMWAMALVSVPAVVFFQSYTLYYFGARYARLGAILTPPAAPGPPPSPAPVPA